MLNFLVCISAIALKKISRLIGSLQSLKQLILTFVMSKEGFSFQK